MTAKDLINYMIPPLKPEDGIGQAQELMSEFKTTELPVSSGGEFLGLIDEDMTYDFPEATHVSDLQLKGADCFVDQNKHYYEVLSTAYNQGFRLVAVVDDDNKYLGVVSIQDVVGAFAQASSINSPGAIIVIIIEEKHYSLSNIARMIEMNEAKILSTQVAPIPELPGSSRMTLKLNTEEISQVRTVLENNDVQIEATFNTSELSYDEKERLDLLMKYLTP